jgi:hypothetical protein
MNEIFEMGRKYGIKECQRTHRHQWMRLSFHIVVGSFVGCAFALLVAFWLTSL